MGGIALLAKQLGHKVSGSDANVYPPMSTQLSDLGISLQNGYTPCNLIPKPDLVVIGNAVSRGNPEVEAVLNQNYPYVSGPQWLGESLLRDRWVVAVAGTHGKTTTSSMIAWILEYAKMQPGFLIGGIPLNIGLSARLGAGKYFVVEADEYDTAFFDKRSKFVHYRPRTAVLNNLEFDHADIFDDIDQIKTQFHHFVRTIPGRGMIVAPSNDHHLNDVLEMGCWSHTERVALSSKDKDIVAEWVAVLNTADGSAFEITRNGYFQGKVKWCLTGNHNVYNALTAIAGACDTGIQAAIAIAALCEFKSVKRRMEVRAKVNGITIYDDFAHHPTAIASTLEGLRARVKNERIFAVVEPRSNTMRLGVHANTLPQSMQKANLAIIYRPVDTCLNITESGNISNNLCVLETLDEIIDLLIQRTRSGDHVVFMSNGSFGGIHERLEKRLTGKFKVES